MFFLGVRSLSLEPSIYEGFGEIRGNFAGARKCALSKLQREGRLLRWLMVVHFFVGVVGTQKKNLAETKFFEF
jgi:hypothetical protein